MPVLKRCERVFCYHKHMINVTELEGSEQESLELLVIESQTFQKQILEQKNVDLNFLCDDVRQMVQKNIESDESAYYIAKDGDKLVGYVLLEITKVQPGQGWLNDLYVTEEYRRQGVARRLAAQDESWLKSKGVTKVTLFVHNTNAEAINFYEKLEYKKSPVYYIDLTKDLA